MVWYGTSNTYSYYCGTTIAKSVEETHRAALGDDQVRPPPSFADEFELHGVKLNHQPAVVLNHRPLERVATVPPDTSHAFMAKRGEIVLSHVHLPRLIVTIRQSNHIFQEKLVQLR